MADTSIEWTDSVWNPVRGCAIVSEGCRNCYAMRQAHRFSGKGQPYEGLTKLGPQGRGAVWTGDARFVPEMLDAPLRWKTPRRVFVNSMSDLFHEDLDAHDVAKVFAVMARAPRHTFQVLTKRADHMRHLLGDPLFREEVAQIVMQHDLDDDREISEAWPIPNVWLGVSVEDQRAADERVPDLIATAAAVRWLSCEPLLGPIDLVASINKLDWLHKAALESGGIDWIVVGGESGPGSRPMRAEWARGLRDQARQAGVALFVKQMGSVYMKECGEAGKGGELASIPDDLRVREYPR